MPRSDWSISNILAIELAAYLDREGPKRILEVGSGLSTAVLATYAKTHGAEVISLEHEWKYHTLTASGLAKLGLSSSVDLRLAPLRRQRFSDHRSYQWYDVRLEDRFDFVFVDGPPKEEGRRGVFFAVKDHLEPGWQMWLDDGRRHHERKCIKLWEERFPRCFSRHRLDIDGKGVFILSDAKGGQSRRSERKVPGGLGIGVLGTGDPDWWRRVRQSLGERLLDSSSDVVTARDQKPAIRRPNLLNKRRSAEGQSTEQGIR